MQRHRLLKGSKPMEPLADRADTASAVTISV